MKKQKNLIMRVLLLSCFVFGMFVICPLKAEAANWYDWGVNTDLYVDGECWIKEGVIKKTFQSDGKGGTAVYNRAENTLTLTNYVFKGDGTQYWDTPIHASCMSDSFRIVLVGTNIIERKGTSRINYETGIERRGIELYWIACTTIEGNGKLISNVPIKAGVAGNKLLFKDCDIEISAPISGVKATGVELENANLNITIEDKEEWELSQGFDANYLKVSNSNLIVKSQNYKAMWINRYVVPVGQTTVPGQDPSERVYEENWENKIVLGPDVKVTDGKGTPLNVIKINREDCYWFVFAPEGGNVAREIHITSTKKSNLNQSIDEVVKLIEQIGIVSTSSKPAIDNARNAYEALSRLGEEADYAKAKVYNYQKLLDAEADYTLAVKQEEERKKQEEANNKQENPKENPKESEAANGTIVGSRVRKADKMVQVKGKKYRVKTPEFKSLKSKKKRTCTLTWKVDKTCSGYQIYYSTNKKFKGAKKLLINKKTTKTKTIKNLRSKKTYYVKIRAYKTIGGKRYYGNFSIIRKIKVK